jgi:hypothetical protein
LRPIFELAENFGASRPAAGSRFAACEKPDARGDFCHEGAAFACGSPGYVSSWHETDLQQCPQFGR